MDVQVRDGFTAIAAVVDHQAVAGNSHSFAAGDFRRREQQMPEQGGVTRSRHTDPRHRLARDNQDMDRGLWRNITECHAVLILMYDDGGNLVGTDFFKQRFVSHGIKS